MMQVIAMLMHDMINSRALCSLRHYTLSHYYFGSSCEDSFEIITTERTRKHIRLGTEDYCEEQSEKNDQGKARQISHLD